MRWIALCALVALTAVCLPACGAPSDAGGETATVREQPTGPVRVAPLSRHDAPPEGVARTIEFHGIGDGICLRQVSAPSIVFDVTPFYDSQGFPRPLDAPEIGEDLHICPRGFAAGEPIEVRVRGPGGVTSRRTLVNEADQVPTWELPIHVDVAKGRYEVEASTSAERAVGSFRVVAPRHRGVRLPGNRGLQPRGETVRGVVVGFDPDERVAVDVYRAGSNAEFLYASTFDVMTDADGVAEFLLELRPDDPLTTYVLHPRVPGPRDQDLDALFQLCDPCAG